MTAGDDPGPHPWVTPEFEIIDTGDARLIAAEGQTGDDDNAAGS
jgi:hypothetical protein